MSKETPKMTAAQLAALKPYERDLRHAVEARWSSPIPAGGIALMLRVWEELAGRPRVGFRNGCRTCIMELLIDLGTIYFDSQEAQKKPAEGAKAPAKGKTTPAKGKPAKTRNNKQ